MNSVTATDLEGIRSAVTQAGATRTPVRLVGGDTKKHLGTVDDGLPVLALGEYSGVIDYDPAELVVRVRAGTKVTELMEQLAGEGQMMAFEPPVHGAAATIGGVVSAGLSGSARPYYGAARDHVLGVGMVLHDGNYCEFGGQVMKNVAGYDVSRLVCGAYGSLGVIADLSLKLLPLPESSLTVSLELPVDPAREIVRDLAARVSPLSGACYMDGILFVRLSGNETTVSVAQSKLGGEVSSAPIWHEVDSQSLRQFSNAGDIWRLSTVPDEPVAMNNTVPDYAVMDWGFAQRWLTDPERDPREGYEGPGHWTRYRHEGATLIADVFQPLSPVVYKLHCNLKRQFDPEGIFNPDRMYPFNLDS